MVLSLIAAGGSPRSLRIKTLEELEIVSCTSTLIDCNQVSFILCCNYCNRPIVWVDEVSNLFSNNTTTDDGTSTELKSEVNHIHNITKEPAGPPSVTKSRLGRRQ